MKNDITTVNILELAINTTDESMAEARVRINNKFGMGYAAEHPELVATFMDLSYKYFVKLVELKSKTYYSVGTRYHGENV